MKNLRYKWWWTNVFWSQWILRHDKYWDHKRKVDRRREYNDYLDSIKSDRVRL